MTAHARIKCAIWRDDDFRTLSVDAQWTYQRLLSDSNRNHAGVLALTRRRWATSAAGMTQERLEAALDELVAGTFVVIDEDTEEVLIRTYMRHNDVASQPNVLKAALRQAAQVESPLLRSALAHELRLLPEKPADTARMTYPDPHAVAEAIDPGPLGARLSVVGGPNGQHVKAHVDGPTGQHRPAASHASSVFAAQTHMLKGSANPSEKPSEKAQEREREKESKRGGCGGGAVALAVQLPLMAEVVVPEPPRPVKRRAEVVGFEEFWHACPRKVGKDAARKAYARALRDGVSPGQMLDQMSKMREFWRSSGTDPRYIPHPSTWLSQGRYEDPVPEVLPARSYVSPSGRVPTTSRKVADTQALKELFR